MGEILPGAISGCDVLVLAEVVRVSAEVGMKTLNDIQSVLPH